MNSTIQPVLNLLDLLWAAADQDAKDLVDAGEMDMARESVIRQETIADVIDAIKNLGGGQRG